MRYPVAIEPGDGTRAFAVVVPDLPGCFTAGDTLDEAIANAEAAVDAWIETALGQGQDVPAPTGVQQWAAATDHAGWIFGIVTVDPASLDDRIERVDITLPRRVLHRLDARARAAGETRSGCIARLTLA